MRLGHWFLIAIGAALAAWGLVAVNSGDAPPAAVPAAHADAAGPGGRIDVVHSQVELLSGPVTRKVTADTDHFGDVKSDSEAEGDRRRESLHEVLGRLEGAPVYVEGIDGPTRTDQPVPGRPAQPSRK